MILLRKNTALNNVVVTLTEKVTLDPVFFLFSFTNDITKETVNLVLEDTSLYPYRFNQFNIDTQDAAWLGLEAGFYTYRVYEQSSEENTDPALAGAEVEVGKMKLLADPSEQHSFTQYDNPTEYKQYGY